MRLLPLGAVFPYRPTDRFWAVRGREMVCDVGLAVGLAEGLAVAGDAGREMVQLGILAIGKEPASGHHG